MIDVNGFYFEAREKVAELDYLAIYKSKDGNDHLVRRPLEVGNELIEAIEGLSKYNRSAVDYDEAMSKGNEFVRLDEVLSIIESMVNN